MEYHNQKKATNRSSQQLKQPASTKPPQNSVYKPAQIVNHDTSSQLFTLCMNNHSIDLNSNLNLQQPKVTAANNKNSRNLQNTQLDSAKPAKKKQRQRTELFGSFAGGVSDFNY